MLIRKCSFKILKKMIYRLLSWEARNFFKLSSKYFHPYILLTAFHNRLYVLHKKLPNWAAVCKGLTPLRNTYPLPEFSNLLRYCFLRENMKTINIVYKTQSFSSPWSLHRSMCHIIRTTVQKENHRCIRCIQLLLKSVLNFSKLRMSYTILQCMDETTRNTEKKVRII